MFGNYFIDRVNDANVGWQIKEIPLLRDYLKKSGRKNF
jgi:hypothetical protein